VLQRGGVAQMPALMVIGFWIVLQLFSGIGSVSADANTGGVAYMAHIGGFAAGCALTLMLGGKRRAVHA
jgi:membrane associated rhomboid family serine protease